MKQFTALEKLFLLVFLCQTVFFIFNCFDRDKLRDEIHTNNQKIINHQ